MGPLRLRSPLFVERGMCDPCQLLERRGTAMTDDAAGLVEFLLARIEEDERIADHVASVSPTTETKFCLWATQFAFDADRMIVAADYQRVLAECAAKRNIINDYLTASVAASVVLELVLRQLASAHQDHAAYRDVWRG